MSAWMRPGPRRWNSFFWPSTTTASLRTRLRDVVEPLHRLAEADEAGEEERAAAEERAGDAEDDEEGEGGDRRAHVRPERRPAEAGHRVPEAAGFSRSPVCHAAAAQLRRDRRHDLVQIADNRVVRDRHDRRLRVGVHRQDPLRALGARDVLRRSRHTAGDVDLGRDLVPRLPHLVGVRAPARHRHRARAADGTAEQRRELLDHGEALRRADAAPTGDDDLRVGERHAAGRRRDVVANADDEVGLGQLRRERLHRARRAGGNGSDGVRRDGQQRATGMELGLLEQAPAPAQARQRERRARASRR